MGECVFNDDDEIFIRKTNLLLKPCQSVHSDVDKLIKNQKWNGVYPEGFIVVDSIFYVFLMCLLNTTHTSRM